MNYSRRMVGSVGTRRTIVGSQAATQSRLTPSQIVVLRLRAEGLTNSQVAQRLVVSEQTVKNHAADAYKRLGTTDIVNAMNMLGWVCLP